MSKCENCIHYDACKKISDVHGLAFGKSPFCDHYKDKSLCVELLVRVGQVVYVPWEWDRQTGIATVTVEEIKLYDMAEQRCHWKIVRLVQVLQLVIDKI